MQVYETLGLQDGVKKLLDQGLSEDALSIVVSELAKFYCASVTRPQRVTRPQPAQPVKPVTRPQPVSPLATVKGVLKAWEDNIFDGN